MKSSWFWEQFGAGKSDIASIPSVYNTGAQYLGSIIGKYDIRCKLEGVRSTWAAPKWCISSDGLDVVLYFELQFRRLRDIPMRYANITISVGQMNSEPVPRIEAYAPSNGFSGPDMAHRESKSRNIDPQVSVTAPLGGLGVSGYQAGRSQESVPHQSWEFTSGEPSSTASQTYGTEVEFSWNHGWGDDFSSLNRKFRTAIALHREVVEKLAISVRAEVKPWRIWHRAGSKTKKSDWLQPAANTDEIELEKILENLELDIIQENKEMGRAQLEK